MPHFLLVCRDSSQPVGVVIIEAPSMLEAHTNARNLADVPFGETHELSAKMMTSMPPSQIGRLISGVEAAQMIGRLVERRAKAKVQDARGQNVAWFYFDNYPRIVQSVAVLFKDTARRRAMIFAQPEVMIETNQASADQAPPASIACGALKEALRTCRTCGERPPASRSASPLDLASNNGRSTHPPSHPPLFPCTIHD
jgi:hypothetical protein